MHGPGGQVRPLSAEDEVWEPHWAREPCVKAMARGPTALSVAPDCILTSHAPRSEQGGLHRGSVSHHERVPASYRVRENRRVWKRSEVQQQPWRPKSR